MARATFVKAARKDYPSQGIKKGESYWWWKFRFGGKHFSKTKPTRSQLTQSNFYGQVYDIEDEIAAAPASEDLKDLVEDIASRLRDLGEECTSNRDNMPEQLQDSDSGQLLEERANAMEAAADEFEGIDFSDAPEEEELEEPVREDGESDEDFEARMDEYKTAKEEQTNAEEYWQSKLEEVQAITIETP